MTFYAILNQHFCDIAFLQCGGWTPLSLWGREVYPQIFADGRDKPRISLRSQSAKASR
jgi:hypothetical protein